jgi:hypothetical protein
MFDVRRVGNVGTTTTVERESLREKIGKPEDD